MNSISSPAAKYIIDSAFISFYEHERSEKNCFQINLIEGSIDWKDLAHSGISFYSTTNASVCGFNTSFLIEKEDEWVDITSNSEVYNSTTTLIDFSIITRKRYKQDLEICIN